MSDLRREIAKPPPTPHSPLKTSKISTLAEEGEEDGGYSHGSVHLDEDSSSSASSVSSVATIIPIRERASSRATQNLWQQFFEQELYLDYTLESGQTARYHVYVTPPADYQKDPLFVCHHGAGSSALSFALFARELRAMLPGAGVLSVDAREHGSIMPKKDILHSPDFSKDALVHDLLSMIQCTKERFGWVSLPSVVLIGHSLGGAVVATVASQGLLGAKLVGFAVIDVVEGSAMEALKGMRTLLFNRPESFPSIEAAIDWEVRSRTVRNPESAQISTPPLLVLSDTGSWVWQTNLADTQPFWETWFTGLSNSFLNGKAAKLLILAGTDRLDKELMIGQMQGKFQMHVFPEAGHFVHEDCPEKTANAVAGFFKRNDRSTLVLPPKVDELLKMGKKI